MNVRLLVVGSVFAFGVGVSISGCLVPERDMLSKSEGNAHRRSKSELASASRGTHSDFSPLSHGSGWGLDACLSRHVPGGSFEAYAKLVGQSGVSVLRERDIGRRIAGTDVATLLRSLILRAPIYENDPRPVFRELKARGNVVVAFASLPNGVAVAQSDNALPEDLLAVYREGETLARDFVGLVDAWEMVGEADLGYCRDLPDRVAAYQKALYLGIRRGAAKTDQRPRTKDKGLSTLSSQPSTVPATLVLMGALGNLPGPWLERAAKNGLLDYTDAYNFHFYGNAEDLAEEITGHRAFAAGWGHAGIPLWITECGLNAVTSDDFLNPQRRQLQADFTVATARQALAAPDVAVFMPFILVHDKDPHAMTLSADQRLPAWEAYAKFTKENPWPARTMAMPPRDPNPIVVQWLPDNLTTIPHKVSGTYRFKDGQPIKGDLRIYNFSDKAIRGKLTGPNPEVSTADYTDGANNSGGDLAAKRRKEAQGIDRLPAVKVDTVPLAQRVKNLNKDGELTIPALGMISVPLEIQAQRSGYFREFWSAAFRDESGRNSSVYFGMERWPVGEDFTTTRLAAATLAATEFQYPISRDYTVTSRSGAWIGTDGLEVRAASGDHEATELTAWIDQPQNDPLHPIKAVASVAGLPPEGFLRVQLDRPMSPKEKVRVDFLDDRGRRFTVWENFGASYFLVSNEVWLNFEDFHNFSWGRTTPDYRFTPQRVREIQLRFYLAEPNSPMRVRLSVMQPRRS